MTTNLYVIHAVYLIAVALLMAGVVAAAVYVSLAYFTLMTAVV